jgi:hypothetical protein
MASLRVSLDEEILSSEALKAKCVSECEQLRTTIAEMSIVLHRLSQLNDDKVVSILNERQGRSNNGSGNGVELKIFEEKITRQDQVISSLRLALEDEIKAKLNLSNDVDKCRSSIAELSQEIQRLIDQKNDNSKAYDDDLSERERLWEKSFIEQEEAMASLRVAFENEKKAKELIKNSSLDFNVKLVLI